jgi:hypothetical protein
MTDIVERLRHQKAQQEAEDNRQQAERRRAHDLSFAAGRGWAERQATCNQLRVIADKGACPLFLGGIVLNDLRIPREVVGEDAYAFARGAMEVWNAVKSKVDGDGDTVKQQYIKAGAAKILDQEKAAHNASELAARAIFDSKYRPPQRPIRPS